MIFFVVAALAFLITQIPRELRAISIELERGRKIERSCPDTPLERLASIIDSRSCTSTRCRPRSG